MTNLTAGDGTRAERIRFRLYGIAFFLVIVLLVALAVALYNKAFTPVYHVKVRSDRAGLQLLRHSDVKVRGLVVGEVRGIKATQSGAEIDLAINPDKARQIPGNVSARMLPKTVFGEKFVDLVPPDQNPAPHLRNGSVIAQDKTTAAIEVETVLNHLLPVLRAVKPEKLNATLNAVATALQGRGMQLGETIEVTEAYLRKFNKHLPDLVDNIKAIGNVSTTYESATPDLMEVLRNLQTTNNTIVDKRHTLAKVIDDGISVVGHARDFTSDNESKLVGVQIANRKSLALLARYSPGLPCLMDGLAKLRPRAEEAAGGKQPGLHITLELVKPRPAYKKGLDDPEYGDHRNPRCYSTKKPFPDYQLLDGTEDDQWWKEKPEDLLPLPGDQSDRKPNKDQANNRPMSGIFFEQSGTAAETDTVKGLLGPMMGTSADQVPDYAAMLFSPLTNGSVVQVR